MAQVALSYSRDGHGPDLLLMHGGVGSRNHWTRNIPELSRHFRVTAVDLPGFGASPDVPPGIIPADYVACVADAIGGLGLSRFRLVAFSFGAVVAAGVAAGKPDAIAALTLIAPGGFGVPRGRNLGLRPAPPEGLGSDSGRETLRHNLGITMFADPATADDATVEMHRSNIERSRFDSRRVSFEDRLIGDLRRISCPLQLVWGEHDEMAYPSIDARVEKIRAVRPDVRLDLIPGAGHWVQYEKADAFNRVLLDFMQPATTDARHPATSLN